MQVLFLFPCVLFSLYGSVGEVDTFSMAFVSLVMVLIWQIGSGIGGVIRKVNWKGWWLIGLTFVFVFNAFVRVPYFAVVAFPLFSLGFLVQTIRDFRMHQSRAASEQLREDLNDVLDFDEVG